jgi:hypothetical protein
MHSSMPFCSLVEPFSAALVVWQLAFLLFCSSFFLSVHISLPFLFFLLPNYSSQNVRSGSACARAFCKTHKDRSHRLLCLSEILSAEAFFTTPRITNASRITPPLFGRMADVLTFCRRHHDSLFQPPAGPEPPQLPSSGMKAVCCDVICV